MAKAGSHTAKGESFRSLEEALGRDHFSSVYLLHGNEPFLIERAVDLIVDRALGRGGDRLNLQVFAAEESDAREITLSALAYPMLGGRRVVVVKDVEKVRDAERLAAYVADPNPSTVLVLTCAKTDFRQKLFQALQKTAFLLECRTPYDDRIPGWIESEVKRAGKEITPEAAALIHFSVGKSLSDIGRELEKLHLYVGGRNVIDADDVAAVVGVSRNFSIFDLQRAVGLRDAGTALDILARMIDRGENMTGCIVQLTRYFEKLWLLPDRPCPPSEAASLIGVREFFAGEYVAARRRYTSSQIEDSFRALRDADVRLKSSGGTPRLIMTLLLHRILRPETPAAEWAARP